MRQTTLSVPLEVKPESCVRLMALVDALRDASQPAGFPDQYARLLEQVPALHFLSISVFPSAAYDPLFVIEANLDGEPAPFWSDLVATFGDDLRAMLRCCKRPLDETGPLYDAAVADTGPAAVAAYLQARTQRPSVFHHGNRGLSRDRILQEARLFLAAREALERPGGGYSGARPIETHARLRQALAPDHPWLDLTAPPRIPLAERAVDLGRLLLFAVGAVLALSAPGLILAPIMGDTARYLMLIGALTAIVILLIWLKRAALPGTDVPTRFRLVVTLLGQAPLLVLVLAVYVALATALLVLPVAFLVNLEPSQAIRPAFTEVLLGLASLPLTVALLLLWLRYLERRDSSHDAPEVAEATLRQMVRREDWIAQNHMGSIVLLKPGLLRAVLVHAGHRGLGLLLRVKATSGYLGSMRTVHFAHWAFVNNGARLMFFSNFDHSWDSYLDDFIEKAHAGLTLAWGSGAGFPPTRFVVLDGASHGRQFKAWALASRAVSRFWYSAYRDLTVDQIERQARIAAGLRKRKLNAKEAEAWLRDL